MEHDAKHLLGGLTVRCCRRLIDTIISFTENYVELNHYVVAYLLLLENLPDLKELPLFIFT